MIRPKNVFSFPLAHDPLRWTIAAVLLLPTGAWGDGGLQPATGAGGTPQVQMANGVPVVNIVAPNGQGLSHNQFQDFNVPNQGLVLNNSLAAGQAQLAGQLAANPQFQGAAASTILNEVISQNTSDIRGMQEIFGQSANYVLANPNGISINGGGFINTPRATFLVGTPELQDGRITGLNTLTAAGALNVAGKLANETGAVDLIAPRIDTQGETLVRDDLNLIAGLNRVTYDDTRVIESRHTPAGDAYDASLFGAMNAGRIRIISTRDGAGVRLGAPQTLARQGLEISSAGDLAIHGKGAAGKNRTIVSGGTGDLKLDAKRDLNLASVRAAGNQLGFKAGRDLRIDSHTRERISKAKENWDKKTLFITTETYDKDVKTEDIEQIGSVFTALAGVDLEAGRDITMVSTDINAQGAVKAKAGNDVEIAAGVSRKKVDTEVRHRKHLWRGDENQTETSQTASRSSIKAASIAVEAGGKLRTLGSELSASGDITLSGREVEITSTALEGSRVGKGYRGDLVSGTFFGGRQDGTRRNLKHQGSDVEAKGTLKILSDDVRIAGSRAIGETAAQVVGKKGAVVIDSVENMRHETTKTSESKAFGLVGTKRSTDARRTEHQGSQVMSDTNLELQAATDVKVKGSEALSQAKMAVMAGRDLLIEAARDTDALVDNSLQRGFTGTAQETKVAEDGKDGSRQYDASIGYSVAHDDTNRSASTLKGSQLTAGTMDLKAGKALSLDSSNLTTTQGDLNLDAKSIALLSSQNTRDDQRVQSTAEGGLKVTGGMDRGGSAFYGEYDKETTRTETAQTVKAQLNAKGDLNMVADNGQGAISSQAASITAEGKVNERAGTIDRTAMADVDTTTTERNKWAGSLGASLEWRDLTRPIEKAAQNRDQTRFQQAGLEDAVAPPTLGADLAVNHQNRRERVSNSQAQVSVISGASITSEVAKLLKDEGTQYTSALGKVGIKAGQHELLAAQNSQSRELSRLDADVNLRVDTMTGEDINVRGTGVGGSLQRTLHDTQAVVGSLSSAAGIQIQLGTDGRYEGTRFSLGSGDMDINAGGDITFAQAQNTQAENRASMEGFGFLKVGTSPAAGKNASVMAALSSDSGSSKDSQAVLAQIDGTGTLKAQAGGDLQLQGTRIGTPKEKLANVELEADGTLLFGTAQDSHEANGDRLGGGFQVAASRLAGEQATNKGGGVGGHVDSGRIKERSETQHGGKLDARTATLASNSRADEALSIKGLKADTDALALKAQQGGILVDAAVRTETRDNLGVTAGIGANLSRGSDASSNAAGLYARAKVDLDQLESKTHENAHLRTVQFEIGSRLGTRLKGANVEADSVKGNIAGDLTVASLQDSVKGTRVKVDGKLGHEQNPQGLLNGVTSFAGPAAGKLKETAGNGIKKIDPSTSAGLKAEVVRTDRSTAPQSTSLNGRDGIDLNVEGNVYLTGATLKASQGQVELGSSHIEKTNLTGTDYKAELGLNLSNGPVDLASQGIKAATGSEADKKVWTTGGHDKRQDLEAKIIERKS